MAKFIDDGEETLKAPLFVDDIEEAKTPQFIEDLPTPEVAEAKPATQRELNVPTAALETKESAKAKGDMGANEVAARSYEQATGVDAPENAFFAHLANMGNNLGGRLMANLQMQAAQKIASGKFGDGEVEGLLDKMLYGGTKEVAQALSSAVPSVAMPGMITPRKAVRMPNEVLREWEETLGKGYKTDAERNAARRDFAQELAQQFIAERTMTRQNASTELGNREQGFWATVLGKGPEQIGNTLPYMLGPVGIALHFAEEAAAAGTGLANDEYGFAKDGSFGLVAEGDSAGRAALKGATSAGIETATEIVGGKLAGAVAKRAGNVMKPILARGGKVLVGKFPVLAETAGKVAQSKVGQAASKFGTGLKNLMGWMSKKMHIESLPEENIEELEGDLLNALLGTDRRDSELVDAETGEPTTGFDRAGKAFKEFFTADHLAELNEAMLLTMGGGAFVANMAQRGQLKEVDSFLRKRGLMTDEQIANTDLETKAKALDAYSKGLSEEQVLESLRKASSWVDRLSDKIAGEKDVGANKVISAKRLMEENAAYNNGRNKALGDIAWLRERGAQLNGFEVQTDENGEPKFEQTIVVNPMTGETVTRRQMTDANSGVTIVDTDGTYDVESSVTGEKLRTRNLGRALEEADFLAFGNARRLAERQEKREVLGAVLAEERYARRRIEIVDNGAMAQQTFGGDVDADAPGFITADGTIVLILDNLDNPAEALAALDAGTAEDRGAFADGITFETETAENENGETIETRIARDKAHGAVVIDNGDGTFVVYDGKGGYENAASVEEAIAVANGAKPKVRVPLKSKKDKDEEDKGDEARPAEAEAPAQQELGIGEEPQERKEPKPVAEAQKGSEAAGAVKPAPRAEAPREGVADRTSATDFPLTPKNSANKDFPIGTIVERSDGMQYERVEGELTDYMTGETEPRWKERKGGAGRDAGQSHVLGEGGARIIREATAEAAGARPAAETNKETSKAEKPVEAASGASEAAVAKSATTTQPTAKEDAKAAAKKAKREEARKATLERANAVAAPEFLEAGKAGAKDTRVAAVTDYLGAKDHTRASLHKAIKLAEKYFDTNKGKLGFFTEDEAFKVSTALKNAKERLANMVAADRTAFAERNADIPDSLIEKYVADNRQGTLLAKWLENKSRDKTGRGGFLFNRPRSAAAAKKAVGATNVLVDAKFDGKAFDPAAEGADALNQFFDGMSGKERDKWMRILFGKNTKAVTNPVVTGNDAILEDMGMSMDEALNALRDEYEAFQAWRESGAESDEERYAREQAEAEESALDEEFGPIDDYRREELEARAAADIEYANAKAFVENRATAKDIAVFSPSALEEAKAGDKIRVDHHKKTFDFVHYDAENGILTVSDFEEEAVRYFRVSEDGIREITEDEANGSRNETGTPDDNAPDEKGARAGEGEGREETAVAGRGQPSAVAEGAVPEDRGDAAGAGESNAYGLVAKAIDPEWQAAHPEELRNLLERGLEVSAVAANPNIKGGKTDAVSWPVTATRVNNREDAANIFRLLSNPDYEISKVLYLDKDGNIVGFRVTNIGYVGQTEVGYNKILEDIPEGAYGVVFSHNHPAEQGNEVKPSAGDIRPTETLRRMVEGRGLKLLDHIITDHNSYYSFAAMSWSDNEGNIAPIVSNEAADFWEAMEGFGNAVEKPADTMNMVPYGERMNLTDGTKAKLNALAALASKTNDNETWIVGIDDAGMIAWVAAAPQNADEAGFKAFLGSQHGAKRFAILSGVEGFDGAAFVNAIESRWDGRTADTRPLVVALGEDGELTNYEPSVGLNDTIRSASKAAAPRLANAPKLEGEAQRVGLDILDELGGFLKAPVAELRAPVEPLDRAEFKKLRDVAERLMDHLAAQGYDSFEDMMRFVAANRPDVYERLKDPLRRAWNMNVLDPNDEISYERGNQIFGKIDTELKEVPNGDDRRSEPDADMPSGETGDAGERRESDREDALPVGTGVGAGREGMVNRGNEPRPAGSDGVDGRGAVGDVRQDGERAEGEGQRAGGLPGAVEPVVGRGADTGRGDVRNDEAQRPSEGGVRESVNEVTPGFMAYEPPADLPEDAPKSESLIVESSALASVVPPPIKSKPDIPDSIPENGVLQAHQYHTVCQAVDAHNEMLPDGRRKGYFDGDGTGAGKTRVIAGVILDAMNRKLGGGKALIISKNGELLESAQKDFKPFGLAEQLFELDEKGRKKLAQDGKGIAFTTYASLAWNYAGTDAKGEIKSAGKRGKSESRYAEIAKWLGKDFDGVIAFDEAHTASKERETNNRKQAMFSQAVIDLQNALPNARILYLTATSAYDANDLRFLTRMGLWGEGTGFETREDFASAVKDGGLSMMEILTQGMKANGQYCSRSISFKGVNCKREVASVTQEQKEIYSLYADALRRIHDAAMMLPPITGDRAADVAKKFFGRSLDLFNSLITAMKTAKAIELGRQALAEGKSPVFQLISTNESAKEAKSGPKKKKAAVDLFNPATEAEGETDEAEVGVKDRILAYLNGGGFPVTENLGKEDGKTMRGEVLPEAVELRDEMIALVESLPDMANPIDELTRAFADVGISRITGKSNKNAEAAKFNNGENLALVFSGAGGTGASYHADKRFKNQRQRVQIPIEFGWEPDKFIQALGRSHRNNQVVPPEFVLLTTDIAGEMRFMSTIANRVAAMGAIVGGDRNSSGQVVSSNDSVDTIYGRKAVREVERKLGQGIRIGGMSANETLGMMFINPDKVEKVEATQFLGRLQFLPIDQQSAIYAEIAEAMEREVAKAKAEGTYDDGIRKIDAKRVKVVKSEKMSTGKTEWQTRSLLTVEETYDGRRINHEQLEQRPPQNVEVSYMRNKRSGRLYGIYRNGQTLVRLAPSGAYETMLPLEIGNYEKVGTEDGRKEWDAEYAKQPAEETRTRHYMSGDLIPVWDKIGISGRPFVYRAAPEGERPFIGLLISDVQMPVTLYGFGRKEEARKFFKENAYRFISKEDARLGIGSAKSADTQPYFVKMKIGPRQALVVVHADIGNLALATELANSGWETTWAKDEGNIHDNGGPVYYRELGEDAEAEVSRVFDKYGAAILHGSKVVFESKDGLVPEIEVEDVTPERGARPERIRRERVREEAAMANPSGRTLGERLGMPQMRMRVLNGRLIITNTDKRLKDDLKLAFGGHWSLKVRTGKRYVKSDLKWVQDPATRTGWWDISIDKVPADIRAELETQGVLRATVAPLESVEALNESGGIGRLAQNADEAKSAFVYSILRANVAQLEGSGLKALSEKELVRRAVDESDMSALDELYKRYMGTNLRNGKLPSMIRRAAMRKGMEGVIDEGRVEEIASMVWAGTAATGTYENARDGIIADFTNGNTVIYKTAGSLTPAMSVKIDRLLNDMAERAAKRPEMLTLDSPSRSRESEDELDQQIADEPSAAESILGAEAAVEYREAAEDVLAAKLGDAGEYVGRRMTPEEKNRIQAMDMLDETMFFLPDELQDVIREVLTAERMRGYTEKGAPRIGDRTMDIAQEASGLPPQVFMYRYRRAKAMLNEIWRNIRDGKYDDNIALRASEVEGLEETGEELNEDALDNLDLDLDSRRIYQLILDGEASSDIAMAFRKEQTVDSYKEMLKQVRAMRARARDLYKLDVPPDPDKNPLGLEGVVETKRERPQTARRTKTNAASTMWTPDLFAAANATVNDVQFEKIADGIAAGATDEQIAQDVGVAKEIVTLQRIRTEEVSEEPIDAARVRRGEQSTVTRRTPERTQRRGLFDDIEGNPEQGMLFANVAAMEQDVLDVQTQMNPNGALGYTNAAANEWRANHGFAEIAKKAKVSLDELHRQGAAMANNRDEMRRMVERLERAPYAVSPVEQVALGQFTVALKNEFDEAKAKVIQAQVDGNDALAAQLDAEADEVFAILDRADRVNNRVVGNQLGLAMRARQLTVNKDGTLADYMVACTRAKGGLLTKGEKSEAARLYKAFKDANIELDDVTMADIEAHLDALSKQRLAAVQDEIKERRADMKPEKIERDYYEALAQIRYHGEKRSGGKLHGLPNGQKWIRALEAYHLMNGEGLTDGKPDGAKMVQLLLEDIAQQGVEATAWEVRQMESRMGNLVRPSQDEISKSLRDLHSQMLIAQQIEHIATTGEMPPKTGIDRDEESPVVRALRRERDRMIREQGISRRSYEEQLKSALDAYKTRMRNQIEENERTIAAIEAGRPYEKEERRKLQLDDEAQALKLTNARLRERIEEMTRDPAKEHEKRVERALDALARTIAARREEIAAIEADPSAFDFDAKRKRLEDARLVRMREELDALNRQKKSLKDALYPNGTEAEIARRYEMQQKAVQKSLDRWNRMAAEYEAATSWEERNKAVAPSEKRVWPTSPKVEEARKVRDAARRKVDEFRRKLEREDTRGGGAEAWMRMLSAAPVLVRTMMDMSVGMVQGGRFMRSHPVLWTKAALKATKAFVKERWAGDLAEELKNDPYYEDFKKHGGHLYQMEGMDADVPEDFRALEGGAPLPNGKTFRLSNLPGVKRSARSFSGFLNRAALDLYRCLVEAAGPDGTGATENVKKDFARFVNEALGYGYGKTRDEKGVMRGVALVMDALAWAPRKAVAELKYATGYDVLVEPWANTRRHDKSNMEIAEAMKGIGREKVRHLLGALAFGICGVLLSNMLNGDDDKVSLADMFDPRSSDFMRFRIGKSSYSIIGGDETVWRLLGRFLSGQTKVNGVVSDKKRDDIVKQYLRGKVNPLLGLAWDLATGSDYLGNKIADKTAWQYVKDYALPLTWSAEAENFAMNDPLTAMVNALPVFYGGVKSTYERDPLDRVVAQGDEVRRMMDAANKAGDSAEASRIAARFAPRADVYGAAKGVKNLEKRIKNLEERAKTYKYTMDRSEDGGSRQLRDSYAATVKAIADLNATLKAQRRTAEKVYRKRSDLKWDDMGWAE